MVKILFVCHGNICRSPMAEIIFRNMCREAGVEDLFLVESRATSGEEICGGVGNPVYPAARRELARHGLDAGDKRAERLCREDYRKYDLIIGMDSKNLHFMDIILCGDREGKVSRLLDHTSRGGDVYDPWYTGDFEQAYNEIYRGCRGLLDELTTKGINGIRIELN